MNRCFRDYIPNRTIFVTFFFFAFVLFCFVLLFFAVFDFSSVCALFFPSPDGRSSLRNKVLSVVRLFFQPY